MRFEWDNTKADSNFKKHGVSFDEASSIFYDSYARVISDSEHSKDEDRFIILGISKQAKVLTACYCYRDSNEVIRIISARRATKTESNTYWRYCHES